LQSCKVAKLQSCKVAKLQSCKVAKLQSCKVAKLQSCKVAKVSILTIKYWKHIMSSTLKSYEELLQELQELKKENETLKILYKQDIPLRQKSEEYLRNKPTNPDFQSSEWENLKLIHELQVYQIELEMQNLELTELNASKDKFFSIISHDLKSPFNGFLGLTKLFSENIYEYSLGELQDISKKMHVSAVNLYQLLENLLEWSRIHRGLIEYEPEVLQVYTIVNRNIELLIEFANKKKIEISNIIPDSLKVTADDKMLNAILRNLISNAIKFTPRGGRVEIGTLVQPSEGSAVIYVKDSGIGMTADTISKLFKLEQNVSQKGTEGELSTGLGLQLCKEFIEKQGGRLWVESEIDKGSKFYFSLQSS
jgi:signal transduction histidine kinase